MLGSTCPLDWLGETQSLAGHYLWLLCVHLIDGLYQGHFACYIESFSSLWLMPPILVSAALVDITLIQLKGCVE